MRRNDILVAAIVLGLSGTGCNELIAIDRFHVRDAGEEQDHDGGGMDGGGMDGGGELDAGADGCAPVTSYADLDEDGYGDPATAMESCAPLEGHVTNAEDCDDSDGAIAPGTEETCDNADQDCDGAVDEGLMRPLGELITVEPNFGFGDARASVSAHSSGYTVVWRTSDDATVYASFYGVDGTPVLEGDVVEDAGDLNGPPREPAVLRHESDGVERLIVAYLQTSQITWTTYSPTGSSSRFFTDVPVQADASKLHLVRVGERVALVWASGANAYVVTFHPVDGAPRGPLEITLPGTDPSPSVYVASVDGSPPYLIITPEPDVTSSTATPEPIRVDDVSPLAATALGTLTPPDAETRCASLGTPICAGGLVYLGTNAGINKPELIALHAVVGFEMPGGESVGADLTLLGLLPQNSGTPTISRAHSVGFSVLFTPPARRGQLATLITDDGGGGFVLRELPLALGADGSEPLALAASRDLLPSSGSMYENRGAFIGTADEGSGRDISLMRIGCEP